MVEGPQLDYGIYLLTILLAPFIVRYHCCWLRCPGRPLASLRLALAPAYRAPGGVREGVGGGGFVREGVAEVLGSVGMVTAVDRCSFVLRSVAHAPAYLAPGDMREGVGGGGFVREGVAGALGGAGAVSAADRCSAVLHVTGVPVVAVLAAVWEGGGAQTAVGIKMHIVPFLRRDKPVRRQGCTHLIVLMKYGGL